MTEPHAPDATPLLEARGLTRHFKVGGTIARKTLHAVDDANFTIDLDRHPGADCPTGAWTGPATRAQLAALAPEFDERIHAAAE